MCEFFHGWRRKVGCVTLAMALIATTSWMRSRVVEETLTIPDWRWGSQVTVSQGQVVWSRHSPNDVAGALSWDREDVDVRAQWIEINPRQYEKLGGFAFGSSAGGTWVNFSDDGVITTGDAVIHFWAVPHWSIVLSLTLMSAWLILWKPQTPVAIRTKRDNSTGNLQPQTREGQQ